jgi:uncharacterized UPF0160 family protein
MEKKEKIVTHNGGFHADDCFAVATLLLYLGKEVDEVEIIRTRDSELIKTGDFVVDVGGIYDSATNRFDHHQTGGAGERTNGIPYASFGLVWKEFGRKIVKSQYVCEKLERALVMFIDAHDVGVVACQATKEGVGLYCIQELVQSYRALGSEGERQMDENFLEVVALSIRILQNEIRHAVESEGIMQEVEDTCKNLGNQEMILFSDSKGWPRRFVGNYLSENTPTLYFITQREDGNWEVIAVEDKLFTPRKPFPKEWAGLADSDLQKVTEVSDALFCHNGRFMCVSESKEGAIALAKLALSS